MFKIASAGARNFDEMWWRCAIWASDTAVDHVERGAVGSADTLPQPRAQARRGVDCYPFYDVSKYAHRYRNWKTSRFGPIRMAAPHSGQRHVHDSEDGETVG